MSVRARQGEEILVETPDSASAREPEAELLEGARRGDVSAFERLFQTHGARMKSLAANLLGSASEAEDADQETCLKIYRAAASFRGSATVSSRSSRTCSTASRRSSAQPDRGWSRRVPPMGTTRTSVSGARRAA